MKNAQGVGGRSNTKDCGYCFCFCFLFLSVLLLLFFYCYYYNYNYNYNYIIIFRYRDAYIYVHTCSGICHAMPCHSIPFHTVPYGPDSQDQIHATGRIEMSSNQRGEAVRLPYAVWLQNVLGGGFALHRSHLSQITPTVLINQWRMR